MLGVLGRGVYLLSKLRGGGYKFSAICMRKGGK